MKARTTGVRTPGQQGYTLIELMVVVTIVGILAAVAIPSFNGYLKKSKTSEATAFLGSIKERQAAYYAEFGEFCNVNSKNPPGTPSEDAQTWQSQANWLTLGAGPDTAAVYFQYNSFAGLPGAGQTPPSVSGGAIDDSRGYDTSDFWFISTAVGDLDGDGDQVTFESYSRRSRLWISEDKGWE